MCVILIGKITQKMHKLALETNRDGFSVFSEELGLVKAPSSEQVKRAIGKFGIWHYRIGTSGKLGIENIHPFKVCKGKYLLYHNGVLGNGAGGKSDTALLAEVLYDKPLRTIRSVLNAVATGQRLLLVNATNPKEFEIFGDWKCEEGVLMSHKLYSYYAKVDYGKSSRKSEVKPFKALYSDRVVDYLKGENENGTIEDIYE